MLESLGLGVQDLGLGLRVWSLGNGVGGFADSGSGLLDRTTRKTVVQSQKQIRHTFGLQLKVLG